MRERRYRTFVQRLGAAWIDAVLFGLVYFIIELLTGVRLYFDGAIHDLFFLGYSIFFHGKYGQTPGKMAMNIKVVDYLDENNLIGYQRAAMREIGIIFFIMLKIWLGSWFYISGSNDGLLVLLSSGWMITELVTMWFNRKGRALHDLIADSVVIDVKKYTEWEKKYYYAGNK